MPGNPALPITLQKPKPALYGSAFPPPAKIGLYRFIRHHPIRLRKFGQQAHRPSRFDAKIPRYLNPDRLAFLVRYPTFIIPMKLQTMPTVADRADNRRTQMKMIVLRLISLRSETTCRNDLHPGLIAKPERSGKPPQTSVCGGTKEGGGDLPHGCHPSGTEKKLFGIWTSSFQPYQTCQVL